MSSSEVRDLIERLLMWGGRRLDISNPFVDARLPDGSRLHVAIPEITADHWAVNIRKHLMRGKSLDALRELGVLTSEVADFLTQAVEAGLNILVSGSTQAGKTTLLNSLVSSLPLASRVITIEEVFELKPNLPDCVAMQTRSANLQGEGEIPLRKLIKEALRMRPSHLIVGEIREAESLDLLIALNSGLPGMGTIHANSAKDALAKLQTLPLLASSNISQDFIAPMIASCIDLVVHTSIVPPEKVMKSNSDNSNLGRATESNRTPGKSRRKATIDAAERNPHSESSWLGGNISQTFSQAHPAQNSRRVNRGAAWSSQSFESPEAEEAEAERIARLEAMYRRENFIDEPIADLLSEFQNEFASGEATPVMGSRRVTEILHVTGRIEANRVESEVVFKFDGEKYERGLVNPEVIFSRGAIS